MPLDPDLTEFTTASPILVNYDYTDNINGFGIVNYYGIYGPTVALADFHIISILEDGSGSTSITGILAGTSTVATLQAFNNPRTMEGTAHIFGNYEWNNAGGGSTIFNLYHVDGVSSAETLIGTFDSVTHNADADVQRYTSAEITKTHFAVGDSLRLKATVSIAAGGFKINASTTVPFKLSIPYKIDL